MLDILKARQQPSFQTQYQVIFCLWLLTFSKSICEKIGATHKVVNVLTDVIKSSLKEKVIRVSLATLRVSGRAKKNFGFFILGFFRPHPPPRN